MVCVIIHGIWNRMVGYYFAEPFLCISALKEAISHRAIDHTNSRKGKDRWK